MDFNVASANKAARTRRHGDARHVLLGAAAVAIALLALFLSVAWSDQPANTAIASTGGPSAPSFALPSADTPRLRSSGRGQSSRFFCFLEFDWDPNAPGGVPGFDPWPGTQQGQ